MFTKDIALDDVQIKFDSKKPTKFEGYASVFNGLDSYGDTIIPGAYKSTIQGRKRPPLMLYGHNPGRIIGKWVKLEEDSTGLFGAGELTPGHSDAENVAASLKHGAVSGLSIGFRIPKGGALMVNEEDRKEGEPSRILKQIDLIEISVVSMPADDEARVDPASVKAAIDSLETIRECEDFLRDAGGFSRSQAAALVSQLKSICRRDSGDSEEVESLKAQIEAFSAGSFNSLSQLLKGGLK